MSAAATAASLVADILLPLQPLLEDDEVQEVMINSPGSIWYEKCGRMLASDRVLRPESLRQAITVLGRLDNKDVNPLDHSAILDTRLHHCRIAAALHPVAVDGDSMCLRKHSRAEARLDDYLHPPDPAALHGDPEGTPAPPPVAAGDAAGLQRLLCWMMRARRNVVVSGGTSSGKTTFLNALLQLAGRDERIVLIEDVPELQPVIPNRVRFEVNHDCGISARTLVRLALRYRPDRILLGEVRGAETFDLLQALNTGHSGSVTSIHANSAEDALVRLETLVLTAGVSWPHEAVRHYVGQTIHVVVQMRRFPVAAPGGGRVYRGISRIIEVRGATAGGYEVLCLYHYP